MNERQPVASQFIQALSPWVDVYEEEAGITLLADLPGVSTRKRITPHFQVYLKHL